MDKPKKRNNPEGVDRPVDYGYDLCWDDREKWLKSRQMSVEEIAIICYLSLKGATKEDWKIESRTIHREFRGYGKAIHDEQEKRLK